VSRCNEPDCDTCEVRRLKRKANRLLRRLGEARAQLAKAAPVVDAGRVLCNLPASAVPANGPLSDSVMAVVEAVMWHDGRYVREPQPDRPARRALEALLAHLARMAPCHTCGQAATVQGYLNSVRQDAYACDEHRCTLREACELPRAQALREATRLLGGRRS
jgi:hypothetical protein